MHRAADLVAVVPAGCATAAVPTCAASAAERAISRAQASSCSAADALTVTVLVICVAAADTVSMLLATLRALCQVG